ncbi:hypothetical protein F2Q68_00016263 [Brassica cretica]|uniref:Uncharacterized protein n=1 Tax=Brassica cretica TaxID=69181 RepID=A0A8S9HVH2_BRACR|nr:hypothetical protein F2Q68_00016263 [Brassica cretica]
MVLLDCEYGHAAISQRSFICLSRHLLNLQRPLFLTSQTKAVLAIPSFWVPRIGRFPFLSEEGIVARIRPGAFPSGDPEAGALPGVWRNSTHELPLGRISLQQSRYFGFLSGRSRTLNLEDDRFAGGRPGPSDVFLNLLEMMKPGALEIFEEKAYDSHRRDERVEE